MKEDQIPRGFKDPNNPTDSEVLMVEKVYDDYPLWRDAVNKAIAGCPGCRILLVNDVKSNFALYNSDMHPINLGNRVHGLLCPKCIQQVSENLKPDNVFMP